MNPNATESHRSSLGCVTDGLRRLTLVEYSLGHPMLTSMAATSFSLDEQQHSFFPPRKDNKRLNTNHSYEHTHTHRVVDSHQLGYGQRPVRISGSLDKKKNKNNKRTLNPPPHSVIGRLRCNRCPQSHHLEDNSVLLPLTGPEHDAIIGSDKIHRAQHI